MPLKVTNSSFSNGVIGIDMPASEIVEVDNTSFDGLWTAIRLRPDATEAFRQAFEATPATKSSEDRAMMAAEQIGLAKALKDYGLPVAEIMRKVAQTAKDLGLT